ncbi:ABC transporter ATP-binding protein [Microbacterium trichothecenolyticum]|uniref:NitT/TauT family transport system ATP-binding protein n=1 Tax=Microbacterium trichothecenolyticum TaxID=69370 RepID=A0ABU0TP96_MICTR|nr:ATP-binding cassette domain-containing protein [Microbacterium trichothecenolyticum]MDQ1121492.1 NitT/TauT family transport system ATP-binding protein [Microbacterium trichothecenolyticum]
MTSAVELRSVVKQYGSAATRMTALSGVDLSIRPGTFVSLIGPSGCGKSTLLRIVAGLEEPDSGDVGVHGVSPSEACAAKLLGLVPQTPALLPWLDVRANVVLPSRLNRAAARRRRRILEEREDVAPVDVDLLLAKAGLGDAAHKLPAQLSGGMQQRAAIVRAFALRPDVLLMDEPFSALDEFTRESLQDQLLDLWDDLDTTVLFVTHSIAEAVRLSDTVVVMAPRPGRIVDVIDIDLPRPRNARLFEEGRFHAYEDLIRERLHRAWHMTDAA